MITKRITLPAKHSIRPMGLMGWDMPKLLMTNQYGWGETVRATAYSWYIEGPKQHILVDTGSRAELLRFSPAANYDTPEGALKKIGIKCSDIDTVILTHLYYEHCGYAPKFKNAKFIVQKKELDFAMNPHPSYAFYYDKRLFKDLNFEVIDGDKEVVEGVRIMSTPGHTPGDQSVLVDTEKGVAGITGFCCISQNFEPPVPLNTRDNILNIGMYYDPIKSYDNMLKFRDAVDIIVANHDSEHKGKERIPDPDLEV